MKTGISTHILDISSGRPAPDVRVALEREGEVVSKALTDGDGRAWLLETAPQPGDYQLRFEVASYFAQTNTSAFYPRVLVVFSVPDAGATHFHVPLLLGPFGYSTYRGS